jgi:hypothetical protein
LECAINNNNKFVCPGSYSLKKHTEEYEKKNKPYLLKDDETDESSNDVLIKVPFETKSLVSYTTGKLINYY